MNDQHTPDPHREEPSDVEHTLRLPGDASGQPAGQPAGQADGQPEADWLWADQPTAEQPGHQGPPPGVPQGYGPPPSYAPGPQGQPGAQGPGPYGPRPPYAAYPGAAGSVPPRKERRTSRGLWPAVAALALLVGLLGGALGGIAVEQWNDNHQDPGRTSGGLSDVDTVSKAPLPADNGSIAAVAQKTLPSTVQIVADFEDQDLGATGSGFFLDKQGHVVTNNHVVADAAENKGSIKVIDQKGDRYDATVVGRSPIYDLAVLYIKDAPDVTPASLGTSSNLQIGEGVVAIGSPLGLSSTVTSGIVSALDRPVTTGSDAKNIASYINAVQTDAAINPGNSGGPLVDMRGQVIGVNSAIATTGGSTTGESGNIGVGFAIPIEQVKVTADQILKDGEARYPVIGASVDSDGSGDGAHIQAVEKGSPAEKAGLKKGDVVTKLDDRAVTDSPTLIVAIRSHLPGDEVTLLVKRGGEEEKLQVTLDSKVG